jgi:hypothetical protein
MLSAGPAIPALLAPPSAAAQARSEMESRAIIAQALRASGIAVEEQVVCGAGMADLVTARRDAVIEVKLDLSRKQLYTAIGQVLLYRAAISPLARAIVVGYATEETAGLIDWAAELGVEVICWNAEDGGLKSELSAFSVSSFTLQWRVQSLARSYGITRAADLARLLGQPRQGLYGVWRGTAASISVARLELLALRLGPEPDQPLRPGEWFQWDERGRLVWSIRDVAEQVGLDAAQVAFSAGQYPQQMALFWDGTAKFVFVDTLARLATALEAQARPFDIGELFVRGGG